MKQCTCHARCSCECACGAWENDLPEGFGFSAFVEWARKEAWWNTDCEKMAQDLFQEIAELKRKNALLLPLAKIVEEYPIYNGGYDAGICCHGCDGWLSIKGTFEHDKDCEVYNAIKAAKEGGAI